MCDADAARDAAFVAAVRIEAAQRLLLDGDDGVDHIASAVGFGSVESFRRKFGRVVGTSRRLRLLRLPTSGAGDGFPRRTLLTTARGYCSAL